MDCCIFQKINFFWNRKITQNLPLPVYFLNSPKNCRQYALCLINLLCAHPPLFFVKIIFDIGINLRYRYINVSLDTDNIIN